MWSLLLAPAWAADPVAAPPLVPDARFALALYCNPRCDAAALDALDHALAGIATVDEFSEHAATPARMMGVAGVDFGIPDAQAVRDFGPDVDDPAALGRSEMVVLAWFAGPREASFDTFSVAHRAFADAAMGCGGWIEDLDTQLLFDGADWAARDPRGPIQDWYVVDEAPQAEGATTVRLVTRGLRRYGDFELVVEDVAPDRADDVSWAIDAIAETLHPLAEVGAEQVVDTAAAQGTARFEPITTPRPDDPTGPLLRARFSGRVSVQFGAVVAAEAPTPAPSAGPAVLDVEPVEDGTGLALPVDAPAAPPEGPPTTLEQARAAVRRELDRLEAAWATGLPAGDTLAVSVPFSTRKGNKEYLWVEVTRWQEGGMSGRLATEPYEVYGLHKGDNVNVKEADVYDYVLRRADGSKSGNLTRPFR